MFEVIDSDTILIILEDVGITLDVSLTDSLVLDAPSGGRVDLNLSIDNDGVPANPLEFSFSYIPPLETIIIPSGQQMIVVDRIDIDGYLVVEGELCLI